ncbi:MAG: hypothetical protein E7158_03250 [Firmicutes bacterium]|nr:hypothetical protein [Bacillota bacterium]
MREAIGGTWLFNIVIFFILLFAGYMCLSINYSKAFNVKDKIINEIERNGGVKNKNDGTDKGISKKDFAIKSISDYMKEVGYRSSGPCDKTIYKADDKKSFGCDRDGVCSAVNPNKKYAYCLREVTYDEAYKYYDNDFIYASYYQVEVFYQLDLPVIRSFFDLNIKGDTKMLYRINRRIDTKVK